MNVCFDTCVVIDIAARGEHFAKSFAAYDVCALRGFGTCISAASTSDIVYVLYRRGMKNAQARDALPLLFKLFTVFDVSQADCERAYASKMADYEDALLAHAAARNGVDLVVTRNTRDFAASPVKAMDPNAFVELFKPEGYSYEQVDV